MTTIRPAAAAWFVAAAALVSGCGTGGKQSGTVSGTVTLNNAPIHTGDVNLISKTGAAAQAKIADDGTFQVVGALEAGDYKVYVSAPIPEPLPPGTKAAAPKKFEVPTKFQDPATSGVTVTVKSGANDLKVDLRN